MATASTAKRKLFLGTFIHSKALSELEYFHNSTIAVDEIGKIVAVDKDCGDLAKARETLLPRLGWNEADVEFVQSKDGEFFFPGFIGELRPLLQHIIHRKRTEIRG